MNVWFTRPLPPRKLSAIIMSVRRMSGALVMPSLSLLTLLLLTACKSMPGSFLTSGETAQFTPKEQVADYRVAQCEYLWQVDDRQAMSNALYWLRAMDCAGRLTAQQAREEARQVAGSGWDSAFKQGILLDNGDLSPLERQRMLEKISLFRLDFPDALRPLVQTWRDRQMLLLSLSDERLRNKRLQESNDKQLETLQTEKTHLQYQLDITRRKLENLTDIERRLSTRKQLSGEMPDSESYHRNNAGASHESSAPQAEAATADQTYTPPTGYDADKSTTKEPKKQ